MNPEQTEPYIETFSGKRYTFLHPEPDQFTIVDIAHGLSNKCRFNGQCKEFYSVAQHSVFCLEIARYQCVHCDYYPSILLHDAEEAFLPDIARPIKQALNLYGMFEKSDELIRAKYRLYPFDIDSIDLIALTVEAAFLMKTEGVDWPTRRDFDADILNLIGSPRQCWTPEQAKSIFLQYCYELGIKHE